MKQNYHQAPLLSKETKAFLFKIMPSYQNEGQIPSKLPLESSQKQVF